MFRKPKPVKAENPDEVEEAEVPQQEKPRPSAGGGIQTGAVVPTQLDETRLKATVTQAAKDREITNFPSEYPLPSEQVTDLKEVAVTNIPSKITVEQSDETKLKATVTQAAKDRTISGNVTVVQGTAANLKASVEQSDETKLKATVTQAAKDRTITDVSKVVTEYIINLTSTGIIRTPATGKKIRLKGFIWSSDADIITALRFGTGGNLLFAIQAKGVVGMNLIGCNIEGAVNEALYGYLSGAGNMKGTVLIEEI